MEAGCVEAYNLDGGQSAALMFMGAYVISTIFIIQALALEPSAGLSTSKHQT